MNKTIYESAQNLHTTSMKQQQEMSKAKEGLQSIGEKMERNIDALSGIEHEGNRETA